jgi:hypothetical protein
MMHRYQVFLEGLRVAVETQRHRWITRSLKILAVIVVSIAAVQYGTTKIYRFPPTGEFHGNHWYNPYEDLTHQWLKTNLHAHSISWGGITNGHQSGDEMVKAYLNNGYDVAALSDYHRLNDATIAKGNVAIPVFEHGMNISKAHHLAIGSKEVVYDNVTLWQTSHTKQSMIDRLSSVSELVCVNHPGMRRSHSYESLVQLTGYSLLEVLNGHRVYLDYWDSVLTAGRPVWILGNDDCHDLQKEKFSFAWNLVQVNSRSATSIYDALRTGKSIAVRRNIEINNSDSLTAWARKNRGDIIWKVRAETSALQFLLSEKAKMIRLIGPHGHVLQKFINADSIAYAPGEDVTYVRAEIEMAEYTVYLNPLIRYDGNTVPSNGRLAVVEFFPTLFLRVSIVLSYLIFLVVLFPQTCRAILYGRNEKSLVYEK